MHIPQHTVRRRVDRLVTQKQARQRATSQNRLRDALFSQAPTSHKRQREFVDKLMIPEEMLDIPDDLSSNWFCVPVPSGRRCLVVAANDRTQCFLKNGNIVESFTSLLPSGGTKRGRQKEFCILDCIMHPSDCTIYVLDMLCWRGFHIEECETEFRFFWIASKLSEEDGLDLVTDKNPYKFVRITNYDCSLSSLEKLVLQPQGYSVEGYYFYHKEASYTSDETPLMCYLTQQKIGDMISKLGERDSIMTVQN